MERRQKAKRAQPMVSARRQAARFLAHAAAPDDAAPQSRVFVRPEGAADTVWREVGRVNALPGTEAHTAVRCQKRLVLEHALRCARRDVARPLLHPPIRPVLDLAPAQPTPGAQGMPLNSRVRPGPSARGRSRERCVGGAGARRRPGRRAPRLVSPARGTQLATLPPASYFPSRGGRAVVAGCCGFIGDPVPGHYFADGDGEGTDPKRKVRARCADAGPRRRCAYRVTVNLGAARGAQRLEERDR